MGRIAGNRKHHRNGPGFHRDCYGGLFTRRDSDADINFSRRCVAECANFHVLERIGWQRDSAAVVGNDDNNSTDGNL